jgi:DNA-binding NtrC family response regulator
MSADEFPPESPTQVLYENRGPVLVLRSALLRVSSGPDQGASCPLALQRVSVGSAPDNDLRLTDPLVSRRHFEIEVQDAGYLVRDLRSTNGTFYRGARVGEALVGLGAELRVGSTVLELVRGAERREEVAQLQHFGSLVGSSRAMQPVYGLLAAVAPTDVTVLIEGETGTGKEVVAEEIHRHSPRRGQAFSEVDCGALPLGLIESELFGHQEGAFTGAVKERAGAFERARGGTVFLDEIGELSLEAQTRLLRVLDRRTIKRLGSDVARKVNVRLIAATNRDLAGEVRAGRFRQDLYYRLSVVRIVIPPLRDRREDIPELVRHFLWQAGVPDPETALPAEVLGVLSSRSWPGNVRELRNAVERAILLADAGPVGADAAPSSLSPAPTAPPPPPPPLPAAVERPPASSESWLEGAMPEPLLDQGYKEAKEELLLRFERLYFGRLVRRYGVSNVSQLAKAAGVDRHLLRNMLRKHRFE